MAKRMSNRERIERLAAEKAAAQQEKKTARPTKPAARSRSSAAKPAAKRQTTGGRNKIVWKVFSASFKEVESFPFPERAKAEKMAKDLTTKTGHEHFVNSEEVPMKEE